MDEDPRVEQFAMECRRIERDRVPGGTTAKFQAARTLFTGSPYPKGKQPYQDFALLATLRNDIMHGGEDEFPDIYFDGNLRADPPPIARKLTARKLKLDIASGGMGAYVRWLDSPDVAKWACNSAAALVQSVLDMVPVPIRRNPDPDPDAPASWALCDALRYFYKDAFTAIR